MATRGLAGSIGKDSTALMNAPVGDRKQISLLLEISILYCMSHSLAVPSLEPETMTFSEMAVTPLTSSSWPVSVDLN